MNKQTKKTASKKMDKTPIKIVITKVPASYRFALAGEVPNGPTIEGTINASDLFSLMSLDQYYACVKDGQSVFFMPDFEALKPYINLIP